MSAVQKLKDDNLCIINLHECGKDNCWYYNVKYIKQLNWL